MLEFCAGGVLFCYRIRYQIIPFSEKYITMQRDKAIVIATGEIVTLHYSKERDGDVYYAILEDANRLFIPDELKIIDDKWSFIFKWLPNYNFNEKVSQSDDLQCCIDGEADAEKLERVKKSFGNTPEKWMCAQLEIDAFLLDEAVDNFYNKVYRRPRTI